LRSQETHTWRRKGAGGKRRAGMRIEMQRDHTPRANIRGS
jgi:hypothetical protein